MSFQIGSTQWDTWSGFLQYASQEHNLFTRPGVQDIVILWRVRRGSTQPIMTTRSVANLTEARQLETNARALVRQNVGLVDQFGRQFSQVRIMRALPTFHQTTAGALVRCQWDFLVQDNNIDPQNQNAVV